MSDPVNHPGHYTQGKIEPIDVIEDWKLDYHVGSALKYIARHKHKGKPLEDLKKARWFLDRAIMRRVKDCPQEPTGYEQVTMAIGHEYDKKRWPERDASAMTGRELRESGE